MTKSRFYLSVAIGLGLFVGVIVALVQKSGESTAAYQRESQSLDSLSALPEAPEDDKSLGFVLDQLLDSRESNNTGRKLELIEQLEPGLDSDQREALLYEIVSKRPLGVELEGYADYFHQICMLLIRQRENRERYGQALMTVVLDGQREQVLRDYSLQHLRKLWHYSGNSDHLRDSIVAAFGKLTPDHDLGSSALLSLHLLDEAKISSADDYSVRPQRNVAKPHLVDQELLPYLKEALSSNSSQERMLTALRIVRERGIKQFLPELRSICQRENSEPIMVQMAAISTLANFNQSEDQDLIQSIHSPDLRIIRAKEYALTQLRKL